MKTKIICLLSLLIISFFICPVQAEEGRHRSSSAADYFFKDINTSEYSDVSKYTKRDLMLCPFEISEKQSEEKFCVWLKKQPLAPGSLSEKAVIESCSGIYVPCWSFYTEAAADYVGEYGKSKSSVNKKKKTVWKKCEAIMHHTFDNLLVQAFSKEYSNNIDWILEFDKNKYTYYSSTEAEKYTEEAYEKNLEQSWNEAREKIDTKIDSFIKKDIEEDYHTKKTKVKSKLLTFKNTKAARVLVPVWIYQYSYNGQSYICTINGQNGIIDGTHPYSEWKISALCVLCLLVTGGIGFIIIKVIVKKMKER